ncbi:hypothetical protein HCR16_01465 [Wolbachia pipientis]|uniref:hypothetical protein n=1 Tax=Wolbachia pipientis TaxID=955 RepID=UPI0015FC3F8C|nr:hypothetical protein [Wolbachia pipientis]MBA8769836.1 hypothetical protein [Wolbachia pipientis]
MFVQLWNESLYDVGLLSFQCLTLESRKLNFTPGNKNWIPVSSTGMTPLGTAVIKEPVSATFMTSIIDLDLPSN